jgi:hypothetical protein
MSDQAVLNEFISQPLAPFVDENGAQLLRCIDRYEIRAARKEATSFGASHREGNLSIVWAL